MTQEQLVVGRGAGLKSCDMVWTSFGGWRGVLRPIVQVTRNGAPIVDLGRIRGIGRIYGCRPLGSEITVKRGG